jgi:hypothetical protein
MAWSHITMSIGGMMWDQPFRGIGKCYDAKAFLEAAMIGGREIKQIVCSIGNHDPKLLYDVFRQIEERRGQPVRSFLRAMGLWQWPAWNCTSPVRLVLNSLGVNVTGETPDAIQHELAAVARPGPLASNFTPSLGEADGVGGSDRSGE